MLKPLLVRMFPKLLGSTPASRYCTAGGTAPLDTIGGSTQKPNKRHAPIEEREFARLDDESVKSEQGLVEYELDMQGKKGGVTRPGRTFGYQVELWE